ncbi:hypothetical protein [Paenibacillus amylolyticus]
MQMDDKSNSRGGICYEAFQGTFGTEHKKYVEDFQVHEKLALFPIKFD